MRNLALVLVATLAACGPDYYLTDDVDLTWDFSITLSRFKDDLHSPYVRGAKVTLFADSTEGGATFRGWSIVSSDPTVFRIDHVAESTDGKGLSADGVAIGEGVCDLTLLDEHGHERGVGIAEVMVPDRVELDAHAYLIMNRDDEAPVDRVHMIENGKATYLVRYFRGDRELHGNGVLTVDAPSGIVPTPRTTFFFENREWLTLDSTAAMSAPITISADHAVVGTVDVDVVPESTIADVVLLTQSEKGHKDGDWLVALAQAYDGNGERIFGIDYTWNLGGVQQVGEGDLFRYEFKANQFEMLRTQRGTHADTQMIQADGGFVDSSNNVGCAAAGGGTAFTGVLLGLLLATRRRR